MQVINRTVIVSDLYAFHSNACPHMSQSQPLVIVVYVAQDQAWKKGYGTLVLIEMSR